MIALDILGFIFIPIAAFSLLAFWITGLSKRGKHAGPLRLLFGLVVGTAGGLGLLLVLASLGFHTFDSDRRRIFMENFAMPLDSIHDLHGQEVTWLTYKAWISFTYDSEIALKHPEDYQEVACTVSSVGMDSMFITESSGRKDSLLYWTCV